MRVGREALRFDSQDLIHYALGGLTRWSFAPFTEEIACHSEQSRLELALPSLTVFRFF